MLANQLSVTPAGVCSLLTLQHMWKRIRAVRDRKAVRDSVSFEWKGIYDPKIDLFIFSAQEKISV